MPLTGEEIRANLTRFVAHWSIRDGYERGEAQTFLTELFACYGKRLSDVAKFEQFQSGGYVDLIWPRVCIYEMKSASEAGRSGRTANRRSATGERRQTTSEAFPRPSMSCSARSGASRLEPGRFRRAPRQSISTSYPTATRRCSS